MDIKHKMKVWASEAYLVFRENIPAGITIYGSQRVIDLVLCSYSMDNHSKCCGISFSNQNVSGTAERKIPLVLDDMKKWPIDGIVIIDGEGFSPTFENFLYSTGKVFREQDAYDWLTLYFGRLK